MSDELITKQVVDLLFQRLVDSGAVNYIQDTIEVTLDTGREFDVTIIIGHKGKPTPHELRMEAEAEVERLKNNIRTLEKISGFVIPDGRDISADDYPVIMKILKGRTPSSENLYVFESPYGKKLDATVECSCPDGKCEQWYLASDEVDDTCKAVGKKPTL